MSHSAHESRTVWLNRAVPFLGLALVAVTPATDHSAVLVAAAALLVANVLTSVHHAEVVAHRVGEPFGTLVLALSVTVIEAALILSIMITGGPTQAAVARDAIFAVVMLISTGVMGICLWVGALRYHEQQFRVRGALSALSALCVMAVLVLVLPNFTTSTGPGTYTKAQLAFTGLASLALWVVFVLVQTGRHRDYFLPPSAPANEQAHAEPPTKRVAWTSFGLLIVALVAVVGLTKALSKTVEQGVLALGVPKAVVGIVIAFLVLLPETGAAIRAAGANRLQTSMNLALGSALASIGLTVPVVAGAAIFLDLPLVLGIDAKNMVLMALALLVSALTLVLGRSNVLMGAVHLVLFAAFLFLAVAP